MMPQKYTIFFLTYVATSEWLIVKYCFLTQVLINIDKLKKPPTWPTQSSKYALRNLIIHS